MSGDAGDGNNIALLGWGVKRTKVFLSSILQ